MLQAFSVLKSTIQIKKQPIYIDNLIFKFHYRFTVLILLTATVLVTSRQYIGEHISCVMSGEKTVPQKVINTYCFFTSTYTVVKHLNASYLQTGYIAHPGVGPLPAFSDEAIIRHAYYQWVPFVLFFQAICFYMPHLIWKKKEGGRMKLLVVGLQLAHMAFHDKSYTIDNKKIPSREEKAKNLQLVKKAFISKVHNKPWTYWLVTCEVLNLLNLICNIILTNIFLGNNFYRLGPVVCAQGLDSDIDILDEVFPKVTKCDFYKYGPSGSIQKFDALCVMALNIINEKIYLMLWFWFAALLILTILGLFWRLLTIILHSRSVRFNSFVFSLVSPGKLNFGDVATVTREAHFADWLFLYYLAKSLPGQVFLELFMSLANDMDENKFEYLGNEYEPTTPELINLTDSSLSHIDEVDTEQNANLIRTDL